MRASIHVSAAPSAPCREQAVLRVDADAVAGAVEVVLDDLLDDRGELVAQVGVAGRRDVAVERVEEPERAVDRVVLERAGVRRVGEHPSETVAADVSSTSRPSSVRFVARVEPLVGGHQVARPLPEPGIARRPRSGAQRL